MRAMRRRLSALVAAVTLVMLVPAGGSVAAQPDASAAAQPATASDTTATLVGFADAAPGSRIDLTDRLDAARAYTGWLVPALDTPVGWSGDAASCRVGEESAASRAATIAAVNYFRSMAGLPTVAEDPAWSRQALATATMMAAARDLSHYPGPDWPCFTQAGEAGARSSNLSLGRSGARAVFGQMEDRGAHNYPVGHRRWILYPPATRMGTGSTAFSNALWVIDDAWIRSAAPRPTEPDWVAWPPAGPVPWEVAFVVDDDRELFRWSLSPNAVGRSWIDLRSVQVEAVLAHGGQRERLLIRVEQLAFGMGDPTVVFSARRSSDRLFPVGEDAEVIVTVSSIRDGDVELAPHRYTVELFRGAFGDIADSVHRRSIEELDARQIAGGYADGTFRPDRSVTRGQLATFLVNAFALPAASGPARFVDTAASTHGAAAEALAAAGLAGGYADGTFRPDQRVTRGQLATYLVEAVGLPPVLPPVLGPARFVDTAASTHGASVEAFAAAGLAGGYADGTFRPDRSVTRGQLATFLVNALEHPAG